MNLREIEIFHAIMRAGSITEAGRRLGISQPAVSAALKHAEDQIGMQLFRRIRGRLEPTPEAMALFPEVEFLFQKLQSVRHYARDLRGLQAGVLSVASTPTLNYAYVSPVTARFCTQRPNVRMVLQTTTTRQIVEQASTRQIDVGVVANLANTKELESMVFATSEIRVLMHADHPLAAQEVLRPRDLAGWPLITNTQHSLFHRIERAFRNDGAELRVAIACNHYMTICLLVRDSRSVAIVDTWMPQELFPDLARRRMHPRLEIHARLIWSKSRRLSRLAEAFCEDLQRYAATRSAEPSTA